MDQTPSYEEEGVFLNILLKSLITSLVGSLTEYLSEHTVYYLHQQTYQVILYYNKVLHFTTQILC